LGVLGELNKEFAEYDFHLGKNHGEVLKPKGGHRLFGRQVQQNMLRGPTVGAMLRES